MARHIRPSRSGNSGDGIEDEKEGYVAGDSVRVDVHALARGLAPGEVVCRDPLAAYLRAVHPATAEVQGACSNDEHREGGEHERRTEDSTDTDLARGLRVPAREDGCQDGYY